MSFSNKYSHEHHYLQQQTILLNNLCLCKIYLSLILTVACVTPNYHVLYVAENLEKMSGDKMFCLQEKINLKFTLHKTFFGKICTKFFQLISKNIVGAVSEGRLYFI